MHTDDSPALYKDATQDPTITVKYIDTDDKGRKLAASEMYFKIDDSAWVSLSRISDAERGLFKRLERSKKLMI